MLRIADPDIEIAVGRQDHPVDAGLVDVFAGKLISLTDALAARRAAAGRQVVERGLYLSGLGGFRRFKHGSRTARVGDDGDQIVGPEIGNQHLEGLAQQRQLVRIVHRPGGVDQEHQIGFRRLRTLDLIALDPDPHQAGFRIPGRGHDGNIRLERLAPVRGHRIIVVEVVHHLLGPDRILGRQDAPVQRTADEGISSGVDIGGEGRHRIIGDPFHRVVGHVGKAVAALVLIAGGRIVRAGRIVVWDQTADGLWRARLCHRARPSVGHSFGRHRRDCA